ncbi:YdeI/OmpD-associated family protein [Zobellia galactanivorans]|uniref:YdeI/OmpD-associated family protein n=1 Tax=Zobellia galactanivorans (strain DSM 12802 / CCUG 47099 / CIP 106680 / NCIMB 13871 / Dsij) TaxID=63186 RepID=UPI001C07CDF1|nr:DUF1801 domain-containing protein [Zobellia galactanivorans]MBU3025454.1 YdeI/OmpD-associated family protein [Zobellia galactanivorans]
MDIAKKVEAYYAEAHHFKNGVALLRQLVLKTDLEETYKWNFPTYTLDKKKVLAICKFKHHFGIWFFNGVFLNDPENLLENAQKGKTQAMRHWKFFSEKEINPTKVSAYLKEAIENQKKGIEPIRPSNKKNATTILPAELKNALGANPTAKNAFKKLPPYKQREYAAYITEAQREKTKLSRLDKILPMISEGKGLNDLYR